MTRLSFITHILTLYKNHERTRLLTWRPRR